MKSELLNMFSVMPATRFADGVLPSLFSEQGGDEMPWKLEKRQTLAISYRRNKRASVILVGACSFIKISGSLEVKPVEERMEVCLHLDYLLHPQNVGSYYTTYVVWAIVPQLSERALNLGWVPIATDHSARMRVTIPAHAFGLMVTAEPHPLVTHPGPMIVAENLEQACDKRHLNQLLVDYEGDPGTFYHSAFPSGAPITPDYETPLCVLGARRAVDIACRAGAGKYAKSILEQAAARSRMLDRIWRDSLMDGNFNKVQNLSLESVRLAEAARATAIARTMTAGKWNSHAVRYEADITTRAENSPLAKGGESAGLYQAKALKRLQSMLPELLEARQEERGLVLRFSDLLFHRDHRYLDEDARASLSKLTGMLLSTFKKYSVVIEGHVDATSPDAQSQQISQDRANSVRNQLVHAGLPAMRIVATLGMGKSHPLAASKTPVGRYLNRRTEIILTPPGRNLKNGVHADRANLADAPERWS